MIKGRTRVVGVRHVGGREGEVEVDSECESCRRRKMSFEGPVPGSEARVRSDLG